MKKISIPAKIFLIAATIFIASVVSVVFFQLIIQAVQKISAGIPIIHN